MIRFTCALIALTLSACTQLQTASTPETEAAAKMAASEAMQKEARVLNRMVAILSDANTLYAEAANMSKDDEVTVELAGLAAERRKFGHDLQAHVAELGAVPVQRGEALGTAHRAWTKGRALVQDDTLIAAEEVLRGENYLVDEIEVMLDKHLSASTRVMLERELANIVDDRDRLAGVCRDLAKRN